MKDLFPYKLYTQKLFCRRCQRVMDHSIFAEKAYSTLGGLESHIPLLCSCHTCQTIFIGFSHEFVFCRPDQVNNEYTKIYGYNRIVPGNWLYFKGGQKPGIVKSVFQGPQKEVVNISYDNGPVQKIECPKVDILQEKSPKGYRILPAQSAVTLMGDHIYHVIRDVFGIAVGLVWDGEKDKLVVLLESNTLLFITLPTNFQNLSNDKLLDMVRSKLTQVFPQDVGRITLEASRGIVYLGGSVKNLSIKLSMIGCINSLPKVRGCVGFVKIQWESFVADAQIERQILGLLESPTYRFFDYKLQVVGGKVNFSACCNEIYYSKDFENKVAEMPGVVDLNCDIKRYENDALENQLLCKEIETDLAVHGTLQNACIKVSYIHKRILLEGYVHSVIQKQIAFLVTKTKVKTISVENRLRLV